MANYDDNYGFARGGGKGHPAAGYARVSAAHVDLDFAAIAAARDKAGVSALAAGDTLKVMDLGAGMIVQNVTLRVVQAETEAPTAQLAVGSSTTGTEFIAGATIASAGYRGGVPGVGTNVFAPADSGGKLMTSDGGVFVKITTAVPEDAIVRVVVVLIDVS